MLDDQNVIRQRDAQDALTVAANMCEQVLFDPEIIDADHDGRKITSVVIAGMGGSALAADLIKSLYKEELNVPLEVVKGYSLPGYANKNTLVIATSHSGNTEETVSCLEHAIAKGCQIATTSHGAKLADISKEHSIMHIDIPHQNQPRMEMLYNLRAIVKLLVVFGLLSEKAFQDIAACHEWLKTESARWKAEVPTEINYAKQLALIAVGKTPVFVGGELTGLLAYKWKISWNENGKNVAYYNQFPEFNHNEMLGWTSHPIEKPFVIFDLVSELEHPRILKRFALTDRLLSGKRPKANIIPMEGSTLLEQMLRGCILADFVSIYVGILNGVDPTEVNLIEKFKKELA